MWSNKEINDRYKHTKIMITFSLCIDYLYVIKYRIISIVYIIVYFNQTFHFY